MVDIKRKRPENTPRGEVRKKKEGTNQTELPCGKPLHLLDDFRLIEEKAHEGNYPNFSKKPQKRNQPLSQRKKTEAKTQHRRLNCAERKGGGRFTKNSRLKSDCR